MIKRTILLSLILLFTTWVHSQQFDYLYDTTDDIAFEDFIELDSTYLFIGNKTATRQAIFVWLSKSGTLLKDSIDTNTAHWRMVNILKNKSDIILVETNNDSIVKKLRVKICNQNLRLKKQFVLTNNLHYGVGNSRLLQDSILAMVGLTTINSRAYDACVNFLNINSGKDTLLNIGSTKDLYDYAADIFYLNGKYYITKKTDEFYNAFKNKLVYAGIVRLNKDLSWDTIVPITNSIRKPNGIALYFYISVLKLNSSTFMMCGKTGSKNISTINGRTEDISVVKWDTNFVELNTVAFGKTDSSALESYEGITRFENDSFVYSAGTENYIVNVSGYDTSTSYFMLSKLNLQGNVLWTRYYSNDSYLQLYRVKVTADGGAIMMGTSYDDKTANGYENDVWVVKVDSNGNLNYNTSVVERDKIPKDNFVFFPNPVVEDKLIFRQLNVQQDYQLELVDINGKLIYKSTVTNPQKQIDCSTFSKGTYIYILSDKSGNKASGKIIRK